MIFFFNAILLIFHFGGTLGQEVVNGIPMASGPHLKGSSVIMPHNFSYEVKDAMYGNYYGHEVVANEMEINGRYYVLLPDGRVMTVNYTADHDGYRPTLDFQPFVKEGMFADFLVGEEAIAQYQNGGGKKHKHKPQGTTSEPLTAPPGSLLTMPAIMMMSTSEPTTGGGVQVTTPDRLTAGPTTPRPPLPTTPRPVISSSQRPTLSPGISVSPNQPITTPTQGYILPNPGVTPAQGYILPNPGVTPNLRSRIIRSTVQPETTNSNANSSPIISTTEEPFLNTLRSLDNFDPPSLNEESNNFIENTNSREPLSISTLTTQAFFIPEETELIDDGLLSQNNVLSNQLNNIENSNEVQIEVLLPAVRPVNMPRPRKKEKSWKPPLTAEPLTGGPVRMAKMVGDESIEDLNGNVASQSNLISGQIRNNLVEGTTQNVNKVNTINTIKPINIEINAVKSVNTNAPQKDNEINTIPTIVKSLILSKLSSNNINSAAIQQENLSENNKQQLNEVIQASSATFSERQLTNKIKNNQILQKRSGDPRIAESEALSEDNDVNNNIVNNKFLDSPFFGAFSKHSSANQPHVLLI